MLRVKGDQFECRERIKKGGKGVSRQSGQSAYKYITEHVHIELLLRNGEGEGNITGEKEGKAKDTGKKRILNTSTLSCFLMQLIMAAYICLLVKLYVAYGEGVDERLLARNSTLDPVFCGKFW
jgi:hypothetical protein